MQEATGRRSHPKGQVLSGSPARHGASGLVVILKLETRLYILHTDHQARPSPNEILLNFLPYQDNERHCVVDLEIENVRYF